MRVALQGLVDELEHAIRFAAFPQERFEALTHVGIRWLGQECLGERLRRLSFEAKLLVSEAELRQNVRISGLESESALVLRDGFFELSRLPEPVGQKRLQLRIPVASAGFHEAAERRCGLFGRRVGRFEPHELLVGETVLRLESEEAFVGGDGLVAATERSLRRGQASECPSVVGVALERAPGDSGGFRVLFEPVLGGNEPRQAVRARLSIDELLKACRCLPKLAPVERQLGPGGEHGFIERIELACALQKHRRFVELVSPAMDVRRQGKELGALRMARDRFFRFACRVFE